MYICTYHRTCEVEEALDEGQVGERGIRVHHLKHEDLRDQEVLIFRILQCNAESIEHRATISDKYYIHAS